MDEVLPHQTHPNALSGLSITPITFEPFFFSLSRRLGLVFFYCLAASSIPAPIASIVPSLPLSLALSCSPILPSLPPSSPPPPLPQTSSQTDQMENLTESFPGLLDDMQVASEGARKQPHGVVKSDEKVVLNECLIIPQRNLLIVLSWKWAVIKRWGAKRGGWDGRCQISLHWERCTFSPNLLNPFKKKKSDTESFFWCLHRQFIKEEFSIFLHVISCHDFLEPSKKVKWCVHKWSILVSYFHGFWNLEEKKAKKKVQSHTRTDAFSDAFYWRTPQPFFKLVSCVHDFRNWNKKVTWCVRWYCRGGRILKFYAVYFRCEAL